MRMEKLLVSSTHMSKTNCIRCETQMVICEWLICFRMSRVVGWRFGTKEKWEFFLESDVKTMEDLTFSLKTEHRKVWVLRKSNPRPMVGFERVFMPTTLSITQRIQNVSRAIKIIRSALMVSLSEKHKPVLMHLKPTLICRIKNFYMWVESNP